VSDSAWVSGASIGDRFVLDAALAPDVWSALDRHALEVVVVRRDASPAVSSQRFERLTLAHARARGVGPSPRAFGEHQGEGYFARERLVGPTLAESLDRDRAAGRQGLEPSLFDAFVRSLCTGVARLHSAGITHGYLDPSHVVWTETKARLLALDSVHNPPAGVVVGEAHFLSDRRWGGLRPSPTDDLWGLALIAYECAAGRSYWNATDSFALATEAIRGAIDPPSARAASQGRAWSLPRGFDDWFLACLSVDDARAYSDGAEALDALETLVFRRRFFSDAPASTSDDAAPSVCLNVATPEPFSVDDLLGAPPMPCLSPVATKPMACLNVAPPMPCLKVALPKVLTEVGAGPYRGSTVYGDERRAPEFKKRRRAAFVGVAVSAAVIAWWLARRC
jgi:hypothetical protein